MTYRDSEREEIVDELLLDVDAANGSDVDATDADATSGVRQALLSLGSFANLAAPAPDAELSAMLEGPHDEVTKRRWRNKHRTAVVSVAVVAAMGLGASGVAAASSGFTRNPSFIGELLGNVRPQSVAAAPVLPVPDAPRVSTEPAPVVDPAAIPSVPAAASIPLPDRAAPAETPAQAQAQAQDVLQVPAPAAAPEAPASAGSARSDSSPGHSAPRNVTPNLATADPVTPNPQPKPAPITEKQQAPKPDASLQGAGKPAHALPGADIKPGLVPPVPGNPLTEEQFRMAADKWKQWLKHGDRR
ncbi:hypothetical protein [Paenarthrobacter sp.]|uniref:hypothetical protein n=1 Tax=Paenarthrobacter sp. TaxID=1931993 RepID=UPI00281166C4|nr:hypothetical protein [Paenarthrobacter sp.]